MSGTACRMPCEAAMKECCISYLTAIGHCNQCAATACATPTDAPTKAPTAKPVEHVCATDTSKCTNPCEGGSHCCSDFIGALGMCNTCMTSSCPEEKDESAHHCGEGTHFCWKNDDGNQADAKCVTQADGGYTCECPEGSHEKLAHLTHKISEDWVELRHLCEGSTTTPTAAPSAVPTGSPTHAPTEHACDDGSHRCDTKTTYCVPRAKTSRYDCKCLEGFLPRSEHRTHRLRHAGTQNTGVHAH